MYQYQTKPTSRQGILPDFSEKKNLIMLNSLRNIIILNIYAPNNRTSNTSEAKTNRTECVNKNIHDNI